MFKKEQVQKAIKEIDDSLAALNGPRQVHIALVNNVQLVQAVCMEYFDNEANEVPVEEIKDVGTNIIPINTKPGNQDF